MFQNFLNYSNYFLLELLCSICNTSSSIKDLLGSKKAKLCGNYEAVRLWATWDSSEKIICAAGNERWIQGAPYTNHMSEIR